MRKCVNKYKSRYTDTFRPIWIINNEIVGHFQGGFYEINMMAGTILKNIWKMFQKDYVMKRKYL